MDEISKTKNRGRPTKTPGERVIKIAPGIKPSTKQEIDRRASMTGKSIGDIIDEAIEKTRGDY